MSNLQAVSLSSLVHLSVPPSNPAKIWNTVYIPQIEEPNLISFIYIPIFLSLVSLPQCCGADVSIIDHRFVCFGDNAPSYGDIRHKRDDGAFLA